MERGVAAAFIVAGVLVALGVSSVALAIATYGFFPSCGSPSGIGSCPQSLGTSQGLLGGVAAIVVGALVGAYAYSLLD